ncbi:hypothetical protein Taro_011563 [Colocasia esculenta]|uniref:Uncharacterized protein n=1 Tax=Colocasia esculenta TaxID=4460 RepID=A0A843UD08_COLES|nr:hypothetical protein [Colocasia esculenta]
MEGCTQGRVTRRCQGKTRERKANPSPTWGPGGSDETQRAALATAPMTKSYSFIYISAAAGASDGFRASAGGSGGRKAKILHVNKEVPPI